MSRQRGCSHSRVTCFFTVRLGDDRPGAEQYQKPILGPQELRVLRGPKPLLYRVRPLRRGRVQGCLGQKPIQDERSSFCAQGSHLPYLEQAFVSAGSRSTGGRLGKLGTQLTHRVHPTDCDMVNLPGVDPLVPRRNGYRSSMCLRHIVMGACAIF